MPAFAVEKILRGKPSHFERVRMARDAGVCIAMGTDAGTPFKVHGENLRELKRLADVGYSPMGVMESGIRAAAQVLRLEKDLGARERGRLADLFVMEDNPLRPPIFSSKRRFPGSSGRVENWSKENGDISETKEA